MGSGLGQILSASMEAFPAYQLTTSEQYVTTIVGGFSIVGSIIIILAYSVVDQSATTLWRTLMLFLSVFDLQQGLYYVSVGVFNYTKIGGMTPLCAGIGLSNIYSTTASYLCTACVAFLVNDIVRPNPKVKSGVRLKIIFLGYPFFVSILALVLHEMGGDKDPVITVGRDQYGCYINQKHQILRWIASYIPLLISWFLCAWFNWTAYQRLKQVSTASSSDENVDETNPVIHNMMRRLLIVPFGFIILRLPDLSFRLIELLWRSDQDGTVAHWAMALQSGEFLYYSQWHVTLLVYLFF